MAAYTVNLTPSKSYSARSAFSLIFSYFLLCVLCELCVESPSYFSFILLNVSLSLWFNFFLRLGEPHRGRARADHAIPRALES